MNSTHTVNDIHSLLNQTQVAHIECPKSTDEIREAILRARGSNSAIAISGGRHAMGGQQFLSNATLLDMRSMNRILHLDYQSGIVEVEAGILWSELVPQLRSIQSNNEHTWSIIQKQTGADRLSLGGALAANGHGRGLNLRPIIQDVESFILIDHNGEPIECSRTKNQQLFNLAIGGYGLFGVITSIKLRLMHSYHVERVVELFDIEQLPDAFESRIKEGFTYGDFQYMTGEASDSFLRSGVFSCYRPIDTVTTSSNNAGENLTLSEDDWSKLIHLAHIDKSTAFDHYARFYMNTNRQTYHIDDFQMSTYIDGYHQALDASYSAAVPGSETITELYVPLDSLVNFMNSARDAIRDHNANIIYGTIRLIEPDNETFLNWASQRYSCIVFNLHVDHSPTGRESVAEALRSLIDIALSMDGSYFLTYNRFATSDQLKKAYPQFPNFLKLKQQYDPGAVFSSDWHQHYRHMATPDLQNSAT